MVTARRSSPPDAALEGAFAGPVVGFDEVGRGAWAGPLVVGAAVLPADIIEGHGRGGPVDTIRDSKRLSERRREEFFDILSEYCAWALGIVGPEDCDRLGMADAQRLATRRALAGLRERGIEPVAAIADGKWDFVTPLVPVVEMRVKADEQHLSVCAASILAKVSRDRSMREQSEDYPLWAFDTSKGYPCARHRAGLYGYGPSAIHRRSWVFMDDQPWSGVVRVEPVRRARAPGRDRR